MNEHIYARDETDRSRLSNLSLP